MYWFSLLACKSEITAEMVYKGDFYINSNQRAEVIAITDGQVVALDEEATSALEKGTSPIELEGSIFPGFHDAHTHLLAGSFVMDKCLMVGVSSMSVILSKVEDYANSAPSEPWVVGYGWLFTLTEEPNGVAFDAFIPDRPAAVFDSSGHAVLVNSVALELAGIDANTPDPPGGIIVKDESGDPTGLLQESAIELISTLMLDAYDDESLSANLIEKIEDFRIAGITRISEILAVPGVNIGRPWIYTQLDESGDLNLRIEYYLPAFRESDLPEIEALSQYESEHVHFAGVKLWVDGSSGSGQSWSIDPSVTTPEFYGSQYLETEDILPFIKAAEDNGYHLKLHVNGDAAVQAALDAFDIHVNTHGPLTQRHVLDHLVLISDADYLRIYNLGLIASMQPAHALVGAFGEQADHWDDGRFENTWDLGRIHQENIPLALGTDWPVWPTPDLMVNLSTATQSLGEKGVDLQTAIEAYTMDLSGQSAQYGCLEVGCTADMTRFETNPFTSDDLSNIEILDVWLSDELPK